MQALESQGLVNWHGLLQTGTHKARQEPQMKKIEAIIKPFKLDEVKEALQEVGICRA